MLTYLLFCCVFFFFFLPPLPHCIVAEFRLLHTITNYQLGSERRVPGTNSTISLRMSGTGPAVVQDGTCTLKCPILTLFAMLYIPKSSAVWYLVLH